MYWQILLILFFVFINGFFVAAEFAIVKLGSGEVASIRRSGTSSALAVEKIAKHLDSYLSACQLGITLASLALGWIGEPLVARMIEPVFHWAGISPSQTNLFSFPIAFLVITFIHITFGEQIPKIMAIWKHRSAAVLVALPLILFFYIFRPFIWVLNSSSNGVLRLMGFKLDDRHDQSLTEEEIRSMVLQSAKRGFLKSGEHFMIENVLDLEEKIARKHMIQRHDIEYLDIGDPIQENLEKISKSTHTRFPVCEGDLDNIIGLIHTKDILNAILSGFPPESLRSIVRNAFFFPETISLDKLMVELQRRKVLMALLVDEFGGFSGIITLENIMEELIGSIEDEFDNEQPEIIKTGNGLYEVDADCSKEKVIRKCTIVLPESSADSIGGVMMDTIGYIPLTGEKLIMENYEIEVIEAEPTGIKRVLIRKREKTVSTKVP